MGQQQLILLVLATVIVGIAIVVGIRAFTENSTKSNYDALVQDAIRIANDAQAWKQKPDQFGGQGGAAANDPDDFTGATLPLLGYALNNGTCYQNLNGNFKILTAGNGSMTIAGHNPTRLNYTVITVNGLSDTNITQTTTKVGTSTLTELSCS